jgi:uncharacterized protein with HEPN domain
MRDDRARLEDMRDAIRQIEAYAARGRKAFDKDPLLQAWFLRQMQNIGEAARSLSEAFRKRHPRWPWRAVIGMRNVLVHRYFEVDINIVWSVVENDLPSLKKKVLAALRPKARRKPKAANRAKRPKKKK